MSGVSMRRDTSPQFALIYDFSSSSITLRAEVSTLFMIIAASLESDDKAFFERASGGTTKQRDSGSILYEITL